MRYKLNLPGPADKCACWGGGGGGCWWLLLAASFEPAFSTRAADLVAAPAFLTVRRNKSSKNYTTIMYWIFARLLSSKCLQNVYCGQLIYDCSFITETNKQSSIKLVSSKSPWVLLSLKMFNSLAFSLLFCLVICSSSILSLLVAAAAAAAGIPPDGNLWLVLLIPSGPTAACLGCLHQGWDSTGGCCRTRGCCSNSCCFVCCFRFLSCNCRFWSIWEKDKLSICFTHVSK